MRAVDVPVHVVVGFVLVQTVLHAQRHLVHCLGEGEVRRRVVNRVAAENEQQVHFAGVHVIDKFLQRSGLNLRLDLDGVGVDHSVANRAERRVHRVCECVHGWRLVISRDHDRRALVGLKVFHQRRDELLLLRLRACTASHA